MFDLRLIAAGITLAGLGLCATVASIAGVRDAQRPPVETAVSEGELLDVSANGQRITLNDSVPAAQLELKRLFNLVDNSDNTPDAPTAEARREFVLAPNASIDPLTPGEHFRVYYRIGSNPCEAVRIERLNTDVSKIEAIPTTTEAVVSEPVTESKLALDIRWALREDNRLSLQARLVKVSQDGRGVVLEGTVPTELEKQLVEEKAQRLSNGSTVLSKLRIAPTSAGDVSSY